MAEKCSAAVESASTSLVREVTSTRCCCCIDAIGSFRQMEIEINQINVIYGGSQLSHYDENAFEGKRWKCSVVKYSM